MKALCAPPNFKGKTLKTRLLEATTVMCQLNVKLASKKIPRLFADFDGVIDSFSKQGDAEIVR